MRYSSNYWPSSTINTKLVELYKIIYPTLEECKWSRKVPDPTKQSVDAFANRVTTQIPILAKVDEGLDKWRVGKYLKDFRQRVYANPIKHGFAWDIADNTRVVMGLPVLFGLLHYSGIGLYIIDCEVYPEFQHFFQWLCTYIGGAYGARVLSNFSLRFLVLTTMEKQYGLRSESGVYYGYKKDEDVNTNRKKSTMNSDIEEPISKGKVSSRKPRKQ